MFLAYLLIYVVTFVVPLLISVGLFLLVRRLLAGRTPYAALVALCLVLAASCVPWVMDRFAVRADLAALARDEIYPDEVALPPGALWYLSEHNHAGVSCHWPCDFSDLPFVTHVSDQNVDYALSLGYEQSPLDTHDLLNGLVKKDTQLRDGFPFDYAFISISGYRDHGVPNGDPYRKPGWPETVKGVHMLVALPPDGQLDFATADIVYRRYNVQETVARPFFWGIATETEQTPSVEAILDDLRRISRVEAE